MLSFKNTVVAAESYKLRLNTVDASPRNCPKRLEVLIVVIIFAFLSLITYRERLGRPQTNTDLNQDLVIIITE